MKPMVIAAPNGARRLKADHPNLPLTIPEIAAEAERCQRA
ncbi:MAG TPA: 3-keto-5-aminohexanoate cleavage protein, partial [Aliiroseovarius sp.]|nr:3-keto-5-aminohexanoate cleavage protein [Aliiroseovarius sp.]